MKKKIFIASDHAGFIVKEKIKLILADLNLEFDDLGPFTDKISVDYPDYAHKVANLVLENRNSYGILICGSGTGMQIAANKIAGIRAAFCYDDYSALMARKDNDANILTLRARKFPEELYHNIIKTFMTTKFSGYVRHKRRISKLENI